MNIEIKNFADSRDLKSLKYIFVDSLDVDPTFVRYEEEYNYCRAIPGLLESHEELTPFTQDQTKWNESYWTRLKMDLLKNFSDVRMTHMREVARVFLADKVQRILVERNADMDPTAKDSTSGQMNRTSVEAERVIGKMDMTSVEAERTIGKMDKISVEGESTIGRMNRISAETESTVGKTDKDTPKSGQFDSVVIRESTQSRKAEQDRMILEAKRKLEQENRETEQKRLADDRRVEQQRQLYQNMNQEDLRGGYSKKAIGIAIAAVAVIALVFIVLSLLLK